MSGEGRLKSSLIKIWLFVAVFLPLTLYLAFWQLDRAEQKESLSQEIGLLASESATRLHLSSDFVATRYKPLEVVGQYLNSYFVLDNRLRQGRVGYEVLHAFELKEGKVILINRGWVPAPAYRDKLPSISVPEGAATLKGYFYWSDKEMVQLSTHYELEGELAYRLQVADWDYIAKMVEGDLAVNYQFRLIGQDQFGAYQIDWKAQQMGPEKHLGYAFQWFSLALALTVLAVFASIKIVRSERLEHSKT
jgi:cytochrome oxidase assembly protein ShyY1